LRRVILGLALIVGGFLLASAIDVLLPGQDPAGKGMAAGMLFFAGAVSGIAVLIAAGVRAVRRKRSDA